MVPTLIALAATAAVIALARRQGWGWLAPMILYSVVWTAAIAIHGLRFFPFYELTPYTWLAISLAFASFTGASLLAGRLTAGSASPVSAADLDGVALVMRAYFLIGLAGGAWFFWQVHQVFGITALVTRPIDVHTALSDRTIGSSHLFLYYLGVAGTMLFGYLWLAAGRRVQLVDAVLLGLFTMVMGISTERNHLLWALACWLFLAVAPPRRDGSLARLVGTGLAIATLGLGFYIGAGKWLGKSADNITNALVIEAALGSSTTPPDVATRLRTAGYLPVIATDVPADSRLHLILPGGWFHQFAVLYMSVGAALPTLDQGLTRHERSYGQLTFRPIFRALSRLGILPELQRLTTYDDVRTPYPANAYTYLYEHGRDFGLAGVVVFPAIFGGLAGWVYRRLSQAPGSYWAVWLAAIQGMILWSPFQNRFVLTVSAYLVAALSVGYLASRTRRSYSASMSATSRSAL